MSKSRMRDSLFSLRLSGLALIGLAFAAGLVCAYLWLTSAHDWRQHLLRAEHAGQTLHDAISAGVPLPHGTVLSKLDPPAQALAARADFERITPLPRPALVTNLPVQATAADRLSSSAFRLAIISSALRYPLSELDLSAPQSPRQIMGKATRLLATYCSDAVLITRIAGGDWHRIEGPMIWTCAAAPPDRRLLAGALALLALFALSGAVLSSAAQFTDFARAMRARFHSASPEDFALQGPDELRRIISALNEYRAADRQHLSERALILSGVSHDLGTPATRLRLRAALIHDPELRRKFEADIDQMTGIIESVLTYTRAELNSEAPRRIALSSLVEAVVADYADVGQPVRANMGATIVVEGAPSIFMSRRGRSELTEEEIKVVLQARPIALQRALSNLIDNALKYGRRAMVSLETDARHAHILIEDEGGAAALADLDQMTAPFQRGANAEPVQGYGMGLTIAAAIAAQHGGSLSFEQGKAGIIARLTIARS